MNEEIGFEVVIVQSQEYWVEGVQHQIECVPCESIRPVPDSALLSEVNRSTSGGNKNIGDALECCK